LSITPPAFEPRRFKTAAAHYLAGRPAYARRLIARVTGLTPLARPTPLKSPAFRLLPVEIVC